ncbi:MAG: TIM barrel protein [Pirellulales bacterium]|nr:TIM barrel protein [Pirellulales bacterium]
MKVMSGRWGRLCLAIGCALLATIGPAVHAADLFRPDNLVAWCIVPFDSARRTPEQRGAMLERLGIFQLAYDWRDEHVPLFDEEVAAMQRHGVRIMAWWMAGPDLNEVNRKILDVVRRHGLRMQFWVIMGDPPADVDRVQACADAIRPLALEAAKLECQIGLYNHGGWFGEPENQLAILERLQLPNVGIVYNLHHAHGHLERFAEILARIKPHLLALNLNGMMPHGDEQGQKILPIGAGTLDLELLRTIDASGYRGPIGILNHTDLDAEARLADNLDGLAWLVKRLRGNADASRPKFRTYADAPAHQDASTTMPLNAAEQTQVDALVHAAQRSGNALRGATVFASPKFACLSCHRVGDTGGAIGPELSRVGASLRAEEIVEALLWPKRHVKPEFLAWTLVSDEGITHQGYVEREDAQQLVLFETATGQRLTFAAESIVERQPLGSLMPENLCAAMTSVQQRDLVRFLLDQGHERGVASAVAVAHAHQPTAFDCDRSPLDPGAHEFAQHPVNRDRLYDYYAKEADFFRDHAPSAMLLPEYPGLDGGVLGHWGNQNEDTWRDDRWNAMDNGSLISGVFHGPQGPVARAICVQLDNQRAICFDTDKLEYVAAWRGGFVKFSSVRHGFLDGLRADGVELAIPTEPRPAGQGRYLGLYRHGARVVFAYEIDGVRMLDEPLATSEAVQRVVAPAAAHPARELVHGGAVQWPQVFETQGTLGAQSPYAIDRITLPSQTPWNSLFFFGGHDFLPDGSALLCTMQGEVWHVSGLDANLGHVRWKRFAAGLHHALGLVVADGGVYVLGRDQITRLHDLNGDDEADYYECFCRSYDTSPAGHDFVCGLERDAAGNFYTASGKQGVMRISPDGSKLQILATGLRNPDGLALLPDGSLTVPASEGEWTVTSYIGLVGAPGTSNLAAGLNTKNLVPHFGLGGLRDGRVDWPLVYLPRGIDNSAGGQTYIDSQRWGPLADNLVHYSYGAGSYFLVLRDEVAGVSQGAVTPLPGDFAAGPHRGRFHPHDGQLYVCGMGGWGTYTIADGSFERVRYTGDAVQLPVAFRVHQNGVRVTFSSPLEEDRAGRAELQFTQAWNYRFSAAYGSAEYAPSHPGAVGHDRWPVTAAHVLADGRSVFFEIPDLQPVNQLHLRMQVDAGRPIDLFATVHVLDVPFTSYPGYEALEKPAPPHPQQIDLALLDRPPVPNPWRDSIDGARELRIEAGKNLNYATRVLNAKAGEALRLTLVNPDVVPHNWVLVQPGAFQRVGNLVNRLVGNPEAANRQYVPDSEDILAYTDVVPAGTEFSIYFHAPKQPGRYPFLCSFPGHWMVMNGQLVVEE